VSLLFSLLSALFSFLSSNLYTLLSSTHFNPHLLNKSFRLLFRYHGTGELSLANGETYVGDFYQHKFHGEGKYRWPDGSGFSGSWELGRRCGQGKVTLSSGDCYDGEWADDVANGTGEYVSVEAGVSRTCEWADGQPVNKAVYIQPRVIKGEEEAPKASDKKGGKADASRRGSTKGKGPAPPEEKIEEVDSGPKHVSESVLPPVEGADHAAIPTIIVDAHIQLRNDVVDGLEDAPVNEAGEEQPRLFASLAVLAGGALPDIYLCITDALGVVVTEESGRRLFATVSYTPPPEKISDKKAKGPPPIVGTVQFGLLPKAPAAYAPEGASPEEPPLTRPQSKAAGRPASKQGKKGEQAFDAAGLPGVPPIDATARISVTAQEGLVKLSGVHLHPACTPGAFITIHFVDASAHKERKDGMPVGIPRVTPLPGGTLRVLVEDLAGGASGKKKK
jgi:hypothetical protein